MDIDDIETPDTGSNMTMYNMGVLGYSAERIALLMQYDSVQTITFMAEFGDLNSDIRMEYNQGVAKSAFDRDMAMMKAANQTGDPDIYEAIDMRGLVAEEMMEKNRVLNQLFDEKRKEGE